MESGYAEVVSRKRMRLVTFLVELNNLKCWGVDVSSAYLMAYTSEKVYTIAGPEFGNLTGHVSVVIKGLYGLLSGGKTYADLWQDCLRQLGFKPCLAEPNLC